MSIDVYVYDRAMSPLKSTFIDVLEEDDTFTKVDLQTNGLLTSGLYGVNLAAPAPPAPVIIWIHDSTFAWAPTSLGYLNGGQPARLDVALFPLPSPIPTGGGGGGIGVGGGPTSHLPMGGGPAFGARPVSTPWEIRQLIDDRVRRRWWTTDEGLGVGSLAVTAMRAVARQTTNEDLGMWLVLWVTFLKILGVDLSTTSGSGKGGAVPPPSILPGVMIPQMGTYGEPMHGAEPMRGMEG